MTAALSFGLAIPSGVTATAIPSRMTTASAATPFGATRTTIILPPGLAVSS